MNPLLDNMAFFGLLRRRPRLTDGSDRGRFPCTVIALFVFIGLSCAKQGYPPGGPQDETPPRLVASSPAFHATGVPRNEPVRFEFSEPMDTESVEDNLFIVPIPSERPQFDWKKGDRILILTFRRPLRENTTYVLSIGTKVRDRRRNELPESIMLSFSTGDTIESGRIKGALVPYTFTEKGAESVNGVDVAAYRLDGDSRDPDPRDDVPDYVTQSGSDGSFEMIGLSNGSYRLFAIGDKDRNGFYSEGYDLLGISAGDIVIAEGDSVVYAPDIAVAMRDTSMVQLVSIGVPDSRRIELFFDRPVDHETAVIEFEDLDIIGTFVPVDRPAVISAAIRRQEGGRKYAVRRLEVIDRDGNGLIPLGVVPSFTGKDVPDTTALAMTAGPPKLIEPGDISLAFSFNRVLDLPETPDAILHPESAGLVSVERTASNAIGLIPREPWRENASYSILFDREKLKGAAGNMLPADGAQIEFRVAAVDTLGFITGSIEDSSGSDDTLYHIAFRNVDAKADKLLTVTGPREWTTGPVLPGRYICRAFRDDDGDGELNKGKLSPYGYAEQVSAFPDTIVVVSRWTNDDNTFVFSRNK